MTHLKHLSQALPLHSQADQCWRRTRLTSAVAFHLRIRLGRRCAAWSTSYAPSKGVKCFSTSQAYRSADKTNAIDIAFSSGQPAELPHRASKLLHVWQLSNAKKGVTRQYTFTSFSKAWRFMTLVAEQCKVKKHHPSWHNLYNKVTIEWTTHTPEGLSIKDVEMAEFCDRTANEIGLKG
ncbi:transcriptional coactivator/pterin dehydratase [Ophiobolus disseminans]|uniref:4a-hydroxytetrahydrobiopterin dehydratase n=1 Tax=Ophiobolus disseminans TaxID=1469910 RepID=A0A6A7A5H0_9PLEO|nr:transcriptional coactivator/pterin dehydratase [Ophiobolus disseminans]